MFSNSGLDYIEEQCCCCSIVFIVTFLFSVITMRSALNGVSRALLDRQTIATGIASPSRNSHIWALNNQVFLCC